jgi:WD40 repeat protein
MRKATPYGILAFLTASALAPVAAPSLGGSAEFAAVLNQLGGMGSNYLTEVMTDTAQRLRHGHDAPAELSVQEWRDALAEALAPRLSASDEQARELRVEVGRVLQSVDAVAVALDESAQSTEEVRAWLTAEIRALGVEVEELRWIQVSLAQALAGMQVELAVQGSQQRQQIDLTRRSLLAVTSMRAEILDSISAAVSPAPARREQIQNFSSDVCPFPGLASFQVEDAEWFVGREVLVAELLGRLAEQINGGGPLVLVGVSGVGKSSVLRAGLLPAITRGELPVPGSQTWPWMLLTPGTKPLTELAGRTAALAGISAIDVLSDLLSAPERFGALAAQAARPARAARPVGARSPDDVRLVIVVDQFEELFTKGVDAAERTAFVTALTSAAPALVMLAVRADFYPQCIRLERLSPLLPDQQLVVGPLRVDDLRRAVLQPARRAGLEVEPGLVELLLADLGVQSDGGYEPGSLPLLAYALQATWTRRRDRTLTVDGYHRAGGIAHAVAEAAEGVYQQFDEAGQEALRSALLRTVTVGVPQTGLVRRKARREDVDPTVLARLIEARLVTADEDGVEISHEALLYAWPRLTQWLADDQQGIQLHQQLAQATRDWEESGQDDSLLYRGARLVATREWASGRPDLTSSEERFLLAGTAVAERALRQERQRSRRLRQLVAVMVVLLLAAVTGATAALIARNDERAQAAAARSRQYAAESGAVTGADQRRSMELAALAWQSSPTSQARGALLSAQMLQQAGLLDDAAGELSVALSQDGRWVATGAADGQVRIWNAVTHRQAALLRAHASTVYQVAFSPDGRFLASASLEERGVRIWEVPSGRLLHTLEGLGTVTWRPDGRELGSLSVLASGGFQITIWDPRTGQPLSRWSMGKTLISKIAYSPDGERIAVAHATDGVVELWRLRGRRHLATLDPPAGAPKAQATMAFAPDGTLATGTGLQGQVQFWNGQTGRRLGRTTESPRRSSVSAMAFTPSGLNLIVAGGSQAASVWDVREQAWLGDVFTGQPGTTVAVAVAGNGRLLAGAGTGRPTMLWRLAEDWFGGGENGAMNVVAFDRTGRKLATGGASGTVRVWDLFDRSWKQRAKHSGFVTAVSYAPDGTLASAADDGTIQVFDPSGRRRSILDLTDYTVNDVAFSPDGTLLTATTSPPLARDPGTKITDHHLIVWDVKTLSQKLSVDLSEAGPSALQFTPDGRHLVLSTTAQNGTADAFRGNSTVWLWRTQDLREARSASERQFSLGPGYVADVDLSPDGGTLAVAGADRRIQLWNLATGRRTRSFGSHPATIREIEFSPDGRTIATATVQDTFIRLWDVKSGSNLANLNGHADTINRVAFSPDGSLLASAAADGYVGLWNLRPDRAVQRICQSISGDTLDADWRDLGVAPADAPCRSSL